MQTKIEKIKFPNNLNLKKKNIYLKKISESIHKLTNLLIKTPKFLNLTFKSLENKNVSKKSGLILVYTVYFRFSTANSFLYVIDSLGNLKFCYSAGLLNFKGKQKKNRIQVLNGFFKKLGKLKTTVLNNKPIALHLNNVGFYKYLIVKNLKKKFFIQLIKNYQNYSYNGCRKRKKLRKR